MVAPVQFPLGKLPATYDARDIRYEDIRARVSLPSAPPPHGGGGEVFPAGVWPGWGMFGNGPCDDGTIPPHWYCNPGAGDCTIAGPGHETMLLNHNSGRTVPRFTCLNLLNQYAVLSGVSGAAALTSANDQGLQVRDVLNWRSTTGLTDVDGGIHKIGVYVSITPDNLQALWEAMWFFEVVGIGINFPESAMTQFSDNEIWSVVKGSQINGGHYIPLVGHPVESAWTCITWGQRQMMTNQFITTYSDEAFAYISPERYNAVTGETLERYQDADLEKFITLVGTPQTS